jgi:hypothetical protein
MIPKVFGSRLSLVSLLSTVQSHQQRDFGFGLRMT